MRKRRWHGGIVASTLFAAACKQPAEPPPPTVEIAPADPSVLWREPVTAEHFARRVLYTWTTAEQVEDLRRDRRLLVREESPERGASYFEQLVHELAIHGNATAKLLDSTGFAKSRFAWPAPWATREGWEGEKYGDHLIRVVLKPEAIVLAVDVAGAFRARDLANRPVALDDVAARPERIAAVYFETGLYREYVLCNESMIATWSVGTQDIADELAAEVRSLAALADAIRTTPPTPSQRDGFASVLALRNGGYQLKPEILDQIVRDLRATPRPAAVEGAGNVAFPGVGEARKAPRVVRSRRGTYGTY
jgi:hypothetical protein